MLQFSFFDWHTIEETPKVSGMYFVRDRIGREFLTWYEKGRGFNHVPEHETAGYNITAWKIREKQTATKER